MRFAAAEAKRRVLRLLPIFEMEQGWDDLESRLYRGKKRGKAVHLIELKLV